MTIDYCLDNYANHNKTLLIINTLVFDFKAIGNMKTYNCLCI